MRLSRLFFPTIKEIPSDANIESSKLMLRAAMVRKVSSGLYTYLPIGLRSINKVINIIRDEMDKSGGQEFMFPILVPKDVLTKSSRWDIFRQELFRLKDRHDVDYGLGATHEENFTEIVKREIFSYKELPINLYQIHTKFRDEVRPRFGVIRSREFIMKDAYSFHMDDSSLDETYNIMSETYTKMFSRMGLKASRVKADSGAMGGSGSEEFVVYCDAGEDVVIYCDSCDYRANLDKAQTKDVLNQDNISMNEIEIVSTPNITTIDELEQFFNLSKDNFIKTLIYKRENGEYFALLIRGDIDVNETKLSNYFGGEEIILAEQNIVKNITNARIGFAGPVNLKGINIFADYSIKTVVNGITGANADDKHIKNVNLKRDFNIDNDKWLDVRIVKDGDICPSCDSKLKSSRALELGHIFKLGKKYTDAFDVSVLNDKNEENRLTMGCYGIGVNRTLAAIIEQNYDEQGIIFPISVAPYEVVLIRLDDSDEMVSVCDKIYNELLSLGVEVLYDDRNERAGVKFKDADLIGVPTRMVLGKRGLKNGEIEIKLRREADSTNIKIDDATKYMKDILNKLYNELI